MSKIFEEIEKKFMSGYIESTLEMLIGAIDENEQYEINLNLKNSLSRWNSLEDNHNNGGLSFDDFERHKAQIRKEIIEIFKKIKKGELILQNSSQKILFLAANPLSSTRLQLDKEFREIDNGLRLGSQRDKFELKSEWAVTTDTLMQAFLRENPKIVHFSGHGEAQSKVMSRGKEIDLGGLVLTDHNDQMHLVGSDALEELFKTFKGTVDCVLLNACYSEQQGKIIQNYVPYVIGMNRAMYDDSAIAFSIGFYKALGEGKNIEFAFNMGITSIKLKNLKGSDIPVLLKK